MSWFTGPGVGGAAGTETALKAAIATFLVGVAVRLLFSRGDAQMEQVGSVLMFVGGVGTFVAALLDRRRRAREDRARRRP
jgi:hypothetical protein